MPRSTTFLPGVPLRAGHRVERAATGRRAPERPVRHPGGRRSAFR